MSPVTSTADIVMDTYVVDLQLMLPVGRGGDDGIPVLSYTFT